MEEKLRRLMKHEGINSTRLAEILGIQASGISHIMSGRNNPSYDFLLKLLQRFPQLNPDWLLLDKGPMYRDEIKQKNQPSTATNNSTPTSTLPTDRMTSGATMDVSAMGSAIFSREVGARENSLNGIRDDSDLITERDMRETSGMSSETDDFNDARGRYSGSGFGTVVGAGSIDRIVVFYKDKTFSEYRPG